MSFTYNILQGSPGTVTLSNALVRVTSLPFYSVTSTLCQLAPDTGVRPTACPRGCCTLHLCFVMLCNFPPFFHPFQNPIVSPFHGDRYEMQNKGKRTALVSQSIRPWKWFPRGSNRHSALLGLFKIELDKALRNIQQGTGCVGKGGLTAALTQNPQFC